ncbi:conserved protein of unknown function [Ectopseudomonas oleovorans]|uniref:Uncharacterized protein n=1 Tax=Ectopseudomonas oleovorans TaxID=301 RepID=A0A653B1P5_ECTOL|nr:conserved protein of unknown function [Pseudomonas oleovorans]
MNLTVRSPVSLRGHQRLQHMQRHQMAAAVRAPGFVRGLVQAIYLGHDAAIAFDLEHKPAHVGVIGPDLSEFALGDRAKVRESVAHSGILYIKTSFLHAPGKPSSAADARHALNTPTYCRETGRRIGVCPCPLCSKPKPKED